MCGIAGFFNKKSIEYDLNTINSMVAIQNHRGPDDSGKCIFDGNRIIPVGDRTNVNQGYIGTFGFNRLSILDLSEAGHQPMIDDEGAVAIIFNGEIYNAFDLKPELESKGYVFHSKTDTEVILNLYKEYGIENCLKKLNGMFALAIYDHRNGCAYLARDRFGIKPLYYAENTDFIVFASEVKAIVFSGKIRVELDKCAYMECLTYGNSYMSTLIKGVHVLQPGHYLTIKEHSVVSDTIFFDIDTFKRKRNGSYGKSKRKIISAIRQSVRRQLRSDVRLGCQLSGGVDSSTVSYFAKQDGGINLQDAVSVVVDKAGYSEEKYIDKANRKLGLEVHKVRLGTDVSQIAVTLKQLNWYLDTIPAYFNEMGIMSMAKEAKKYMTVLLSGEGADELLAGYTRLAAIDYVIAANRIKPLIKRASQKFDLKEYVINNEAIDEDISKELVRDFSFEKASAGRYKAWSLISGNAEERQIKYEIIVRLQGLLNRQDKCTMANSIENRVPFLDNEFVEAAFQIPRKHLVRLMKRNIIFRKGSKIQGKYVLKDVCQDIFGHEFAFRRKGSFDIPIRDILKSMEFKDFYLREVEPIMMKHGIVKIKTIQRWLKEIDSLSEQQVNAVWRCVNLEIYISLFVDKSCGVIQKRL